MYVNGVKTVSYKNFGQNKPTLDIGINLNPNSKSVVSVNELVVFNSNLSEAQISDISASLGKKYNISDMSYSLSSKQTSSAISLSSESNPPTRFPVADEDDKLFVQRGGTSFRNFATYDLNLRWKGEYKPEVSYILGDFVSISPKITNDSQSADKYVKGKNFPTRYFVCTSTSVKPGQSLDLIQGLHPFLYPKIWTEDACGRTLNSCSLRFGIGRDIRLPFGAFPGTVTYEYRLPGG